MNPFMFIIDLLSLFYCNIICFPVLNISEITEYMKKKKKKKKKISQGKDGNDKI